MVIKDILRVLVLFNKDQNKTKTDDQTHNVHRTKVEVCDFKYLLRLLEVLIEKQREKSILY